jgi:hypothetical protein
MKSKHQITERWNSTIALVRDLSRDARLTGLASGYAESAAKEMEKITQHGISGSPAESMHSDESTCESGECLEDWKAKIVARVEKLKADNLSIAQDLMVDGRVVISKDQMLEPIKALDDVLSHLSSLNS